MRVSVWTWQLLLTLINIVSILYPQQPVTALVAFLSSPHISIPHQYPYQSWCFCLYRIRCGTLLAKTKKTVCFWLSLLKITDNKQAFLNLWSELLLKASNLDATKTKMFTNCSFSGRLHFYLSYFRDTHGDQKQKFFSAGPIYYSRAFVFRR